MKKTPLHLILITFLLLCITSTGYALFDSNVDKAKDFMKAGMYPQAVSLLEKEINKKPTNAEAHYQLGVCFINQGNIRKADERFSSARRLKSDYAIEISKEYEKAGVENLNKSNVSKANALFRKAVEYQPALKQEIASLLFDAGKSALNESNSNSADVLLSTAHFYDPSLEKDIQKVKQAYGEKLLAIAKDKPKEERKKYIEEANKYVSQEFIDAVFPPPTWKTLFKQEYNGNGYGKKDYIRTAEFGKDVQKGDKIIVTGTSFEVWDLGEWKKSTGKFETITQNTKKGVFVGVKTSKGEKFIVQVQRLVSSY